MTTFIASKNENWDLDRLHHDLGEAKHNIHPHKRPELTYLEKQCLSRLLLGHSPQRLTNEHVIKLGTVPSFLRSTIYRYVKKVTGKKTLKNWRDVVAWLEEAGYRRK